MEAKQFLQNYVAEASYDSFPEGKTTLELTAMDITSKEIVFAGGTENEERKKLFFITYKDKLYRAPASVINGIKKAVEQGFDKFEIIRQGKDKGNTRYITLGVK